ncbi:MAG: twin transmembrane helix small protein [Alphaproteobacteria bacterium]
MSIVIILALIATLAVLVCGIFMMARGKAGTGNLSNRLMRARIIFQFIAMILVLVAIGFGLRP